MHLQVGYCPKPDPGRRTRVRRSADQGTSISLDSTIIRASLFIETEVCYVLNVHFHLSSDIHRHCCHFVSVLHARTSDSLEENFTSGSVTGTGVVVGCGVIVMSYHSHFSCMRVTHVHVRTSSQGDKAKQGRTVRCADAARRPTSGRAQSVVRRRALGADARDLPSRSSPLCLCLYQKSQREYTYPAVAQTLLRLENEQHFFFLLRCVLQKGENFEGGGTFPVMDHHDVPLRVAVRCNLIRY